MGDERVSNGVQPLQRSHTKKRTSVAGLHVGIYETPLPWLQGVWRGKGRGIFPTIKDFEYNEELKIEGDVTNPRPVLTLKQRTWNMQAIPKPMHEEMGFIRVLASHPTGPRVEWVMSAPNGVTTIEEGELDVQRHTITLHSVCIGRSPTARPPHVTEFTRRYEVDLSCDPPCLHYTMDMSTTTTPTVTRHLEAWLVRVTPVTSPNATACPTAMQLGAQSSPMQQAGGCMQGSSNMTGVVCGAAIQNGHLTNLRSLSSSGAAPPAVTAAVVTNGYAHAGVANGFVGHHGQLGNGYMAGCMARQGSTGSMASSRQPIIESYVLGPNGIVRTGSTGGVASCGSGDLSEACSETGVTGGAGMVGSGGVGNAAGVIPIGCAHASFSRAHGSHGMSLLGSRSSIASALTSATSSPVNACPFMH